MPIFLQIEEPHAPRVTSRNALWALGFRPFFLLAIDSAPNALWALRRPKRT